MSQYQIIPINCGEFQTAEKSNFTYFVDAGTKIVAPIIMYLVKGADKLILVDAGGSDAEWAAKYHHPIVQNEDQQPLNALKKLGVNPEDIDIIINTHLHWDHCFNNASFPNARIYVQQKEIEAAISPLPPHYVFYESYQIGMTPQWIKAMDKFSAVDGDATIVPGIEVLPLPGHTLGFQGVLIDTADGKYLIAGDSVPLFENWEGNPNYKHYKHIIPGIHYNIADAYRSYERIEKLGVKVLPGHDKRVFAKKIYP